MNKNDYYLKYLKYKMKYLREKEMQIGGEQYDMTIHYGTKRHPDIVKVDEKMTFDEFISKVPDFVLPGDCKKIIFEYTGRIVLDKEIYTRISLYEVNSVMVKYEYSIYVLIDKYEQMKVLNTDLIKVIYERLKLTDKQGIQFIKNDGTEVFIGYEAEMTLEELGIGPDCRLDVISQID
jgi:hypothetical protein